MPKLIYKCGICHKASQDITEAEACEKRHEQLKVFTDKINESTNMQEFIQSIDALLFEVSGVHVAKVRAIDADSADGTIWINLELDFAPSVTLCKEFRDYNIELYDNGSMTSPDWLFWIAINSRVAKRVPAIKEFFRARNKLQNEKKNMLQAQAHHRYEIENKVRDRVADNSDIARWDREIKDLGAKIELRKIEIQNDVMQNMGLVLNSKWDDELKALKADWDEMSVVI